MIQASQTLQWEWQGRSYEAVWHSSNGLPCPQRVLAVDDTLTADTACRLACEGTALLWCGDYHNAKQLLQAMSRRLLRTQRKRGAKAAVLTHATKQPEQSVAPDPEVFNRYRMAQAQHARTLGMLLLPLHGCDPHYQIPLSRAPAVHEACQAAYGTMVGSFVLSLRELLGVIGAWEWRKKGVPVPALGASIFPHYGVFSPVRGEYIDLVATAPLPKRIDNAWDIGTGSGVLAAVLAQRGVQHILATDSAPRALACAAENMRHLGFASQVTLLQADLFPHTEERADLLVCNPPWLPGRPGNLLERAVYDENSHMLLGFLHGAVQHMSPDGEAWLILSDLAERLGLRAAGALQQVIAEAGLQVDGQLSASPRHGKAFDRDDPLFAARSKEQTHLWRLRRAHTAD